MRTRTILSSVAALALAVAGAVAAPEARAQAATLQQFGSIESVGGFTFYNDKATFWAVTSGGYIRGGYVRVDRVFRGGTAGTIYMTGNLTPRETYDLWYGLYQAAPWRAATTAAEFQNTDLPDTRVSYFGTYTQTIKASYVSAAAVPAGMPRVSAAMKRWIDLAWAEARQVAEAPLFRYQGQGGHLGYKRTIEITRAGRIVDEVTYVVTTFPSAQPYRKEGQLTAAEVDGLKRVCASWPSYPARYAGNPSFVDGIDISTSYWTWGVEKAVFAGSPGNRPASFQAVLDHVEGLADALP